MNTLHISLVFGMAVLIFGSASLFPVFRRGTASRILPITIGLVSLIATIALITVSRQSPQAVFLNLTGWQLPFAAFSVGIDPLSTLFMLPLMLVTFSCATFGPGYLSSHPAGRHHWFFFALLVAGMTGVLLAKNAMLFIVTWELMSLAAFVLVITTGESESTNKAGWIFLVMAHVGTTVLLALFFYLGSLTGSFDFAIWSTFSFAPGQKDIIFILALVAFGCKAGFIPFHLWLPLAHPATHGHVSALLSGIMIKMGLYGILRILSLLTPFHAWWGVLLIIIGGVSALLGILFAAGQQRIKRMLAFSSIENMGIIGMAAGLGIHASSLNQSTVALFAFCGMFFHVVSHALFKSTLFLGAGAVINATGTDEINRLGGLMKTAKGTSLLFLAGTMALCGLPFFSGFIGEFLIYAAGISGAVNPATPAVSLTSLTVIIFIALTGGLALAGFTALFGGVFLGVKRATYRGHTSSPSAGMITAMAVPVIMSILLGIAGFLILPWCTGAVSVLLHTPLSTSVTAPVATLITKVSVILLLVTSAIALTAAVVRFINRKKNPAATSPTWDCGYHAPDATMQYTSTSFTAPATTFFRQIIHPENTLAKTDETLPVTPWKFSSSVEDWFITRFLAPLSKRLFSLVSRLHWLQNGRSEQYVLYIVITVAVIIIWKLVAR